MEEVVTQSQLLTRSLSQVPPPSAKHSRQARLDHHGLAVAIPKPDELRPSRFSDCDEQVRTKMLRAKFGACLPNRKIHRSSIRHGIPLQIRKVSAGGASLRAERTTLRTIAAKTMSNRSPFFCRAQGTPSRPPKICRIHLGSRLSSRRFRPGTQIRVVDAVEDFGPVTEDAAASWPDPVICGDRRARVRQELDLNLMNAPPGSGPEAASRPADLSSVQRVRMSRWRR